MVYIQWCCFKIITYNTNQNHVLLDYITAKNVHTSPLEQIKINLINIAQINSLTPNVPPWCGLFLCPHGHCRLLSILKPDHRVLGNVKQTSEGWEVDVNHCEIAG